MSTVADGRAFFRSSRVRNANQYCWTLTVTNVTGAGLVYQPGLNVETSDQVGNDCAQAFGSLVDEAQQGRVLRDGFRVVIVGKPNAGKSSLLNRLSGQEAAIVTEVAGTTRDVLREQIDVDGLAVELVDTAGLRDDPDRIEAEGIRRAREAIGRADAALWIQDVTAGDEGDAPDEELPAELPLIVVRNKIDLTGQFALTKQQLDAAGRLNRYVAQASAKSGYNVSEAFERLAKMMLEARKVSA